MPDLTASLRRVPKWAWYTSAGVGIAGVGIYVMQNRAGVEDPSATTDPTDAGVTGYPDSSTPSPVPGIVVPDVNVQPGPDSSGIELQTTYISALGELLDTLTNGIGNPSPADVKPPVINIITGGGVPTTQRPGVVTVGKPPSQTKKPKPPARYSGHVLSWWRNPNHNRRRVKGKFRWYWPHDNRNIPPKHARAFMGHTKPDPGTGPHEG